MDKGKILISKKLYFDSAHRNELRGGKFARLHGHTYCLEIYAQGVISPELGWIIDFGEIKGFFTPILNRLDHQYLNEIPELRHNTTLEGLRNWILNQIQEPPCWLADIRLNILGDLEFKLSKIPATCEYPEMWAFSFESAQSLSQLPEAHPCSRIHGHSYFVKVSAYDMSILPEKLKVIYDELDHNYLNNIHGLELATSELLTLWIVRRLEQMGTVPIVVIVEETPSSKCIWQRME